MTRFEMVAFTLMVLTPVALQDVILADVEVALYSFSHFAYSVIFPVLPFLISVTLFLKFLSLYHPANA